MALLNYSLRSPGGPARANSIGARKIGTLFGQGGNKNLAIHGYPTISTASIVVAALALLSSVRASESAASVSPVPLQPLAQQAHQIENALAYLGQPLSGDEISKIDEAVSEPNESKAVEHLQAVLDSHVLALVQINAESRVKVEAGRAQPELVEGGTRLFLVKVLNDAGVTAQLRVESPNSGDVYIQSTNSPQPAMELTPRQAADRWADVSLYPLPNASWASISLYQNPPMLPRLSGLAVEYQILAIYSRDAGQRSAIISFNVGQGTQDIGFRNDMTVLFNARPARPITLRVRDESGEPAMASFVIRDKLNRLYPNPAKRLAPDFFFQPQVYRADGEILRLPEGEYTITYTGGPEYLTRQKDFTVDAKGPAQVEFQLERWIDPAEYGWYSGDHHIHAAGCRHYQNPAEGVLPDDMMRQIRGERVNISSVLTWGPDYYYQKQFFSGHDNPLSTPRQLMHYDLEVSGFPSSHAGHIVLLNLRNQDYPGTKQLTDWPTWDLPILRWAKEQGAVVGFAHSGWGLAVHGNELPNYEVPGFDGIGANEYIVDVTLPNAVDFISAVDTPYVWELNIWYHTLNLGFRTRIAGETDFPCIYDSRVGMGRTYASLPGSGPVSYTGWLDALKAGRSYVSDGKTHLMNFTVGGVHVGDGNSELQLPAGSKVAVSLMAAAYLPEHPDQALHNLAYDEKPYWEIERARIGSGREVAVEIIVNGKPVSSQKLLADGKPREMKFEVPIKNSSWVAARIIPAAHTNPVFVIVDGKPIRASRRSAEWALKGVNQCWSQKSALISPAEIGEAKKAYDHAREVYQQLIRESAPD
jgi:hypothetical protein